MSDPEALRELIEHLVLVDHAALYIVLVSGPAQADALLADLPDRVRAGGGLDWRLIRINPYRASGHQLSALSLTQIERSLWRPLLVDEGSITGSGRMIALDLSAAGPSDEALWEGVFRRLNEARNALIARLSGPLLLVVPRGMARDLARAAPDLWSVRRHLADLSASGVEPTSDGPFGAFERWLANVEPTVLSQVQVDTRRSGLAELERLLNQMFLADELRRMVRRLPDGDQIDADVNWASPVAQIARGLVRALATRGGIGVHLFDALYDVRPFWRDDIQRVETELLGPRWWQVARLASDASQSWRAGERDRAIGLLTNALHLGQRIGDGPLADSLRDVIANVYHQLETARVVRANGSSLEELGAIEPGTPVVVSLTSFDPTEGISILSVHARYHLPAQSLAQGWEPRAGVWLDALAARLQASGHEQVILFPRCPPALATRAGMALRYVEDLKVVVPSHGGMDFEIWSLSDPPVPTAISYEQQTGSDSTELQVVVSVSLDIRREWAEWRHVQDRRAEVLYFSPPGGPSRLAVDDAAQAVGVAEAISRTAMAVLSHRPRPYTLRIAFSGPGVLAVALGRALNPRMFSDIYLMDWDPRRQTYVETFHIRSTVRADLASEQQD